MRILIVEDDERLQRTVAHVLEQNGHVVDALGCGIDADTALRTGSFDLVILDLALPQMDGLSVLRAMRSRGNEAAVIVLTARTTLDDRITGLDLGADDYMSKPFEITEFEARVRAVLRRRFGGSRKQIVHGDLLFDLAGRTVEMGGKPLQLPKRELDILEALLCRAGRVVSKSDLIEAIAGFDDELSHKAIELYVSRLRKRLGEGRHKIRSLRGIGYILEEV